MMRKIIGITAMLIGVACIATSLFLFISNAVEADKAGDAAEEAVLKLHDVINNIKNSDEASADDISSAESGETTDLISGMKIVEIDGYSYIGYVSFPSLGIELPVMAEWDYAKLKISPCRYYGSPETNDFVIAAHSYARHFGRIPELEPGDNVYFTDMNGNVYNYVVGDMERLSPDAVEYMINSDWDLSLYTCTRDHVQRYTVRCERVS